MPIALNWIDWVIVIVVGFYVIQGWEEGIAKLGTDLVSFLGSLWLAIKYHSVASEFIKEKFGVASIYALIIGYVAVAMISEIAISYLAVWIIGKLPKKIWETKWNQVLGGILSGSKCLVIVTFVILLISLLPIRGTVKQDVKSSYFGSRILNLVERYGGGLRSSLDQTAKQVTQFLTVQPKSNQSVPLEISPKKEDLKVDAATEGEMLRLVNAERVKVGAKPLLIDSRIVPVARDHSRDMFERKYFSHYSPEGKDVADRLDGAGIDYSVAGENLAYAPDVATAHEGLMNSEGHRKNILNPEFSKIGIGVIDGGAYGLMFTQVFID